MARGYTLSIGEVIMNELTDTSVIKRFSVKDHKGNHLYVQEVPGAWGIGRDYQVCKNRRVLYLKRFSRCQDAIAWLCKYLVREYENVMYLDL